MQLGNKFLSAWYWVVLKIINRMPTRQKPSLLARIVVQLHAGNANVFHRIGWAYCKAEKYEQSEPYLRKSIALDRHNPDAHHNLGVSLSGQGKWTEALPSFHTATILQPGSSDFWTGLGRCQREIGELPAARASLNEALHLNSNNADALLQLGAVHAAVEDWNAALQCSRAYKRLRLDDEAGYWGECAALVELGKFDEAIATAQETLKINPRSLPAIEQLAWVYERLGQYANAIQLLKRALEIMTDSAKVRGWLTWFYVQVNDLDAASEQQKIVAQLDPSHANELATLLAEKTEPSNNC